MPTSSTRPKRKSRGDTYAEDNGGAGGGVKEKENSAPVQGKKKKRTDDGQEKPPSKVGVCGFLFFPSTRGAVTFSSRSGKENVTFNFPPRLGDIPSSLIMNKLEERNGREILQLR